MEQWRNIALLSAYDVQHALLRDGLIVDLMFFHNISNTADFPEGKNIREWSEKNKLPRDISFSWTGSMDPIPTLATDELVSMAQSVGASFLTLNDLALHEVSTLSHATDDVSVALARDIAKRIRLAQYFSPPTDELVLSAYEMSKSHDLGLVRAAYDMSVHLGHIPAKNVVVASDLFKDPEATAKELEKHKYISFESTIELSPEGQRVTQSIRKSAQGSFIIRILSTIGLPALAKAIIQTVKGE